MTQPDPAERLRIHAPSLAPSPWVLRFLPLIRPRGAVLDLACGSGRHARLLAAAGWRVEAVDRDAAALAGLRGVPGVHTRLADLEGEGWPYFGRVFDAVVVTHYLHRPLLPQIVPLLDSGGVLIYETFMVGQERYGRPSNPAHLLRPGELLQVVSRRLCVVAFEQGEEQRPGAAPQVVQRLCACRGDGFTLPAAAAPTA